MDEQFILTVGDRRFLLGLDEAMEIARVLNAAQYIGTEWLNGVKSGENHVVKQPSTLSAVVSPMTTVFQLELERNRKLMEDKK
jgi:hypothetical protein